MIRTIVTPEQQNISIHLPKEFVGNQVGVIAFIIDELTEQPFTTDKPLTYFASKTVLPKDWLIPEEAKAWQDL